MCSVLLPLTFADDVCHSDKVRISARTRGYCFRGVGCPIHSTPTLYREGYSDFTLPIKAKSRWLTLCAQNELCVRALEYIAWSKSPGSAGLQPVARLVRCSTSLFGSRSASNLSTGVYPRATRLEVWKNSQSKAKTSTNGGGVERAWN